MRKNLILVFLAFFSLITFDSCKKKILQTTIEIPEVNLELKFPSGYSLEKSTGSVWKTVSYDMIERSNECPKLKTIAFATHSSIIEDNKRCIDFLNSDVGKQQSEDACTPESLEDIEKIKKIIKDDLKINLKSGEKVKTLGDSRYYIYPLDQSLDPDIFFQKYVTYLDNLQVTLWVEFLLCGKDSDSVDKAEALVSQLSFKKNN